MTIVLHRKISNFLKFTQDNVRKDVCRNVQCKFNNNIYTSLTYTWKLGRLTYGFDMNFHSNSIIYRISVSYVLHVQGVRKK